MITWQALTTRLMNIFIVLPRHAFVCLIPCYLFSSLIVFANTLHWSAPSSATGVSKTQDADSQSIAWNSYRSFNEHAPLRIQIADPRSARQGTILMWVRPEWDTPRATSKPLLTMGWNDGHSGYLAISQGWWEPLGAHQLYFVVSNQEAAFCTNAVELKPAYWTFLAVSWRAGENGFCDIYVNGQRLSHAPLRMKGEYGSEGELVVGSDEGSSDRRGRSSTGELADLVWLDDPIDEQEIWRRYIDSIGDEQKALKHRWAWLQDSIDVNSLEEAQSEPMRESRVVFDESSEWARSRQDTDRILQQIKDAGFNVYVPSIWHGAGAYFPSRTTFVAAEVQQSASQFDALDYLLRRAHQLKIEVHPWITVGLRGDNTYPQFAPPGTPEGAYDVHRADFRDFITTFVAEVLERYPVDGINLDYIRSIGLCTSQACATDYKQRTGRNLLVDIQHYGTEAVARESLARWQDEAVRDIVTRVRQARDKYRSDAVLSIDGHVALREADRPLQGRDEVTWLNSGLIDVVFDMDYEPYLDIAQLRQIVACCKAGRVIPIFANFDRLFGAAHARPDWVVGNLLLLQRQEWPGHGMGLYIRKMLDKSQQDVLRSTVFKFPARPQWPAHFTLSRGAISSENEKAGER